MDTASLFENVEDVLHFVVTHLPTGFQTLDERNAALAVVEAANPLTESRKAAEVARIRAEREKDLGVKEVPLNEPTAPVIGGPEFMAAVAAAVKQALEGNA